MVWELKVGVSLELVVVFSVGVVLKFCVLGLLKVMVWVFFGVMVLDGVDVGLVFVVLVVVMVKI